MATKETASTQAYVRTRCKYCGTKLIEKYGLKWCGKPCRLGALELDIYERENHLGVYAPVEPENPDDGGGE